MLSYAGWSFFWPVNTIRAQTFGGAVGLGVGMSVGLTVGCALGAAVGSVVGNDVGPADGRAVGYAVGLALGAIVGLGVGAGHLSLIAVFVENDSESAICQDAATRFGSSASERTAKIKGAAPKVLLTTHIL